MLDFVGFNLTSEKLVLALVEVVPVVTGLVVVVVVGLSLTSVKFEGLGVVAAVEVVTGLVVVDPVTGFKLGLKDVLELRFEFCSNLAAVAIVLELVDGFCGCCGCCCCCSAFIIAVEVLNLVRGFGSLEDKVEGCSNLDFNVFVLFPVEDVVGCEFAPYDVGFVRVTGGR